MAPAGGWPSRGRSSRSATTASPRTRFRRRSASSPPSSLPPPASWPVMRSVLVTGGSRGLGLGIVRRLICEGYCAIAVARQMNDQLASTIEHAATAHPGSLHFVPFDLGDVDEIPALVKKLRRGFGAIHGPGHKAALGTGRAPPILAHSP